MKHIYDLPPDSVYDEMDSPVGRLTLVASSQGLHQLFWDSDNFKMHHTYIASQLARSPYDKTIINAKQQLGEYFAGTRQIFDVPLVLQGTAFQINAWQQLLAIPYATTISYGEQAQRLGNQNKARAVGLANGANPIAIIIPCHRVIGTNGHLTGFAGGLSKKQYLLDLEHHSNM